MGVVGFLLCVLCFFFFNQFSTDLLTTFYDLIWNAGWEGSGKNQTPIKLKKVMKNNQKWFLPFFRVTFVRFRNVIFGDFLTWTSGLYERNICGHFANIFVYVFREAYLFLSY